MFDQTRRTQLVNRLRQEVDNLENAIASAPNAGDFSRARRQVLDHVVDVDYFLRKVALSFNIKTDDRKQRVAEKQLQRETESENR